MREILSGALLGVAAFCAAMLLFGCLVAVLAVAKPWVREAATRSDVAAKAFFGAEQTLGARDAVEGGPLACEGGSDR